MNWLRKFMYGRYGIDQLNKALILIALVLIVITGFLPRSFYALSYISYIPIIVYIFRALSRDINKRSQENYQYLKMKNSVISRFKEKSKRIKDSKTHKYFKCPKCSQQLRVPRGQGKISITCPKCKEFFKGKS